MEYQVYLPYVAYFAGVLGRIFIPYIQERIKDGRAFDWRYLVGQAIAAIVALIPVVTGSDWIVSVGAMGWLAAFAYGWAAGDVGRVIQKAAGK
ncbi:MAG: hypothetical protein CUN56_14770 [Phototrophicales bacterium]|nr:MAG: hypothetical protein CUN56_14770 [Phototrophicales bacterium]